MFVSDISILINVLLYNIELNFLNILLGYTVTGHILYLPAVQSQYEYSVNIDKLSKYYWNTVFYEISLKTKNIWFPFQLSKLFLLDLIYSIMICIALAMNEWMAFSIILFYSFNFEISFNV